MKQFVSRLVSIREALTKQHPNSGLDATLDWLTFIVSLLPAPGVAESAAVANKIMNDRALKSRFDGIVAEISKLNDRIQGMESGLQRVVLIGATAKDNTAIHSLLRALFDELKSRTAEFSVDTSAWSMQAIINTLISADWVHISAVDHSRNLLDNAHVTSQKTSLVAKGGSQNVIRDSSFTDDKGSVKMSGEHTQIGKVSLSGPSVTWDDPNSRTEMGGWHMGTDSKGNFVFGVRPDPEVTAQCPNCNGESKFRLSQIKSLSHLSCPLCGKTAKLG